MDVKEYVKLCCVKSGIRSCSELARMSGQSPQNLNNKLNRNDFKLSELERIAECMDADLKIMFINKDTGEAIL